jgi:hypothetical protein
MLKIYLFLGQNLLFNYGILSRVVIVVYNASYRHYIVSKFISYFYKHYIVHKFLDSWTSI